MKYPIEIAGCEGQLIEVNFSFWTGSKILINGEKAPKGKHALEFLVTRNDGVQVPVTLKKQILGMDLPKLLVDGQEISVVEPLKWYQWIWLGAPMLLVFGGGAVGAVLGLIGLSINTRVFRENAHPVLKYVLTGLVSGLLFLFYLGIAVVIAMIRVMLEGS